MEYKSTSLAIVIPVYNSEKTIARLVDELVGNLGPLYRLEIILVNDHSGDRSEEACISLYQRYKDTVRFYSFKHLLEPS